MRGIARLPEPRGRVRFLDDDERTRLLLACREINSPHLHFLVVLALSTGARHGELINLRWKISIHMTGIGGLFGLIYGLSYSMNMPMIYLLMIIAVIAGVLGMSRMLLKAHTPAQVYVGFLSGFFIEVGYCYLTTR